MDAEEKAGLKVRDCDVLVDEEIVGLEMRPDALSASYLSII